MNEWPRELRELVDHIESSIDAIDNAVVAAADLDYAEIAVWLEWIGEELNDLLQKVMNAPALDSDSANE